MKIFRFQVQLERVRDELTLQNLSLKTKLSEISSRISESPTRHRRENVKINIPLQELQQDGTARGLVTSPTPTGTDEVNPTNNVPSATETDEMKLKRKSTYKVSHPKDELLGTEINQLRSLIKELQGKEGEALRQVAQGGSEIKVLRTELEIEARCRRDAERAVRGLEEQLEESERRLQDTETCFLTRDEEHAALKLDLDTLKEENRRLREELNQFQNQVCVRISL